MLTAFLLHDYNLQSTTITPVSTRAALLILDEYCKATELAQQYKKRSTRNDVGFWLAYNNPHSLVATPVGYHFDVFKGGSRDRMKNAQMENKIVLISSKDSNRNSMLALGRGGAGPSKFAYAILDHGTGERRAAWLDIYGEHYANEHNGDLPRQVNQRLIVEYLDREDVGVEDDVRDDFVNDHGPF